MPLHMLHNRTSSFVLLSLRRECKHSSNKSHHHFGVPFCDVLWEQEDRRPQLARHGYRIPCVQQPILLCLSCCDDAPVNGVGVYSPQEREQVQRCGQMFVSKGADNGAVFRPFIAFWPRRVLTSRYAGLRYCRVRPLDDSFVSSFQDCLGAFLLLFSEFRREKAGPAAASLRTFAIHTAPAQRPFLWLWRNSSSSSSNRLAKLRIEHGLEEVNEVEAHHLPDNGKSKLLIASGEVITTH
mmetsp:Transcript_23400/g.32714  ORF Transcript_23400/g.32714 Transcript_23400/m.32714 type:complete len:239 (-) Transcript_23400:504-1220(-)